MKLQVTARKMTLDDAFKAKMEKRLQKLDRFFEEDTEVLVTATPDHGEIRLEITARAGALVFRSEKTAKEKTDALDAAVESLYKQIVRNKDKLETRLRSGAFTQVEEDPKEPFHELKVVRTKHFVAESMTVEEAILQMNLLGHSFFIFRNVQEDNDLEVVYARHDETYGLLIPEE